MFEISLKVCGNEFHNKIIFLSKQTSFIFKVILVLDDEAFYGGNPSCFRCYHKVLETFLFSLSSYIIHNQQSYASNQTACIVFPHYFVFFWYNSHPDSSLQEILPVKFYINQETNPLILNSLRTKQTHIYTFKNCHNYTWNKKETVTITPGIRRKQSHIYMK